MYSQVVAILEAGHPLPFKVRRADVDLPELQVGAKAELGFGHTCCVQQGLLTGQDFCRANLRT